MSVDQSMMEIQSRMPTGEDFDRMSVASRSSWRSKASAVYIYPNREA
jgi:hypothetical protein